MTLTDLGIIGDHDHHQDNAPSQPCEKSIFSYLICGHPSSNKQDNNAKWFVQAPLGTRSQVLIYLKSVNRSSIPSSNNRRGTSNTNRINNACSDDTTINQITVGTPTNPQLSQIPIDPSIVPTVLFCSPDHSHSEITHNDENENSQNITPTN